MADTFNPIKKEENLSRLGLFQSRPTPMPGTALVLFREGRDLVVLGPTDRLTPGEARFGGYKKAYHVDIGEHTFGFNCTLPCRSDAFDFHAEAEVTCAVREPATIVDRQIRDARAVLEPLIIETMRGISRNHNVEDSGIAEGTIAAAVLEKRYDTGFEIKRFTVRLRLEDEARTHIRQLKQVDQDTELFRKQVTFQSERESAQAQLELQREKFELERVQMKMEFYGPLIKKGQWELLALQLGNHPEDVGTIVKIINESRNAEFDRQLSALKLMIDKDALETFHLEDMGKQILSSLVGQLAVGPADRALALSPDEEDEGDFEGEGDVSGELADS